MISCGSSSSDADGACRYTYQESNGAPQDLSATLFEALRTSDRALWERYFITAEELRAYREDQGRHPVDDAQIQEKVVETIRGNFADLRDKLRHEEGVHGPARIRCASAKWC